MYVLPAMYVNESALGSSVPCSFGKRWSRVERREVDHVLPPLDAHVGTYTAPSQ